MIVRVGDDSFNGFAVVKTNTDPKSLHNGRVLVEVQGPVAKVAIKGENEEDRFCFSGRDLLYFTSLDQGEADGFQGTLGLVAKQLVDCPDLTDGRKSANGMVFEANDNLVGC